MVNCLRMSYKKHSGGLFFGPHVPTKNILEYEVKFPGRLSVAFHFACLKGALCVKNFCFSQKLRTFVSKVLNLTLSCVKNSGGGYAPQSFRHN